MKAKRTVIDLSQDQPEFDFDEAEHSPSFTFPEYQKNIVLARLWAGATDMAIVGATYVIFLGVTFFQMPAGASLLDKRLLGIYGAGFFLFAAVYFFLFMLSSSQTPGMKIGHLIVVTREDVLLDPRTACIRGFGYLISILPLMLGFIWAAIDPEHLTWADKVSGTYVKKL